MLQGMAQVCVEDASIVVLKRRLDILQWYQEETGPSSGYEIDHSLV